MSQNKNAPLIANAFEMPLQRQYVQPGVHYMEIRMIQSRDEYATAEVAFKNIPGYNHVGHLDQFVAKMKNANQEGLRIIVICERLYSAQMCASRLCSLKRFYAELEEEPILSCLSFSMLDQHLNGTADWIQGSPSIIFGSENTADTPDNDWIDKLSILNQNDRDIFIALLPSQQNRQFIQRLQFEYGYQIFQITENNLYYHCSLLLQCLRAQLPIANDVIPVLPKIVQGIQDYRGDRYSEWDLHQIALNLKKQNKKATSKNLLEMVDSWQTSIKTAQKELDNLIGLIPVKQQIQRILAAQKLAHTRKLLGDPVMSPHNNLAFFGEPGTCKSVVARLTAQIMKEEGFGTGAYVEAGREHLIGQYLGQTSPKIAALFEKAKGGVLFIDEAGALSEPEKDCYVEEAVNALVRHMELNPDTIVIFATYPQYMKQFLNTNPGLSSRISRLIQFQSYSPDDLLEILCYLSSKQHLLLEMDESAKSNCKDFFKKLKEIKKDHFGNGREARRLLETATEELALCVQSNPNTPLNVITGTMLQDAQMMLLEQAIILSKVGVS